MLNRDECVHASHEKGRLLALYTVRQHANNPSTVYKQVVPRWRRLAAAVVTGAPLLAVTPPREDTIDQLNIAA
jgi:hypothetical protein